jgi:thioredoxin-related protein
MITLLARLFLGCIFAIAGVAKLRSRRDTERSVEEFGIPKRWVPTFALVIPIAELLVATLLLASPVTMWWGALGAALMLISFTIVMFIHLVRGRHPQCNCFGHIGAAPISSRTIIRNLGLLCLTGFVLWPVDANQLTSGLKLAFTLVWHPTAASLLAGMVVAVLFLQGCLIVQLMRQNGRLLLRIERLESPGVSQPRDALPQLTHPIQSLLAPPFALPDLTGASYTLTSLCARGQPVLLLFTDPACELCADLLPDVAHWQQVYDSTLTIAIISRGSLAVNQTKLAPFGIKRVLLQDDDHMMHAYRIRGTPAGVLIQPDGTFTGEIASGPTAVRALVISSLTTSRQRDNSQTSDYSLPIRHLVDTSGVSIDFFDHSLATLLLFWERDCQYCQELFDMLQGAEPALWQTRFRVVIVTASNVEPVPMCRFVYDTNHSLARLFKVPGAPAALIVNADGIVSTSLAVGSRAVRALIEEHIVPIISSSVK